MNKRARRIITAVVRRDLMLASRRRQGFLWPLAAITVLGLIALRTLHGAAGTGWVTVIPWAMAAVSALQVFRLLFDGDTRDGTFAQLLIAGSPPSQIVAAKALAHWLLSGLPIIVFVLACSAYLTIPATSLVVLLFSLLVGTPTLSIIAATLAALQARQSRFAISILLLVVPLYLFVLIDAVSVVQRAGSGMPLGLCLALLCAVPAITLPLVPGAVEHAYRPSEQ